MAGYTHVVPRLMLAAPKSGGGKTVLTCGLLTALTRRGLCCAAFKCGPDYIDPMFHCSVLGIAGGNLDTYFMGEDGARNLLAKAANGVSLSVIEGVMGFYDGISGDSTWASSYETARATDTPVVLILDGKGAGLSLAAMAKGFLDYRKDSHICGVILNRTSGKMAERLTPVFQAMGLQVYGYLPVCKEAVLESRHLGLVLPGEQKQLRQQLCLLAGRMEESVDIDGLIALAGGAGEIASQPMEEGGGRRSNADRVSMVRVGVACDEAFCFYYQENRKLMESLGAVLVPFSPLHDASLPEDIHGLLLGGGYPELHAKALSENIPMLRAIRSAAIKGMPLLAECGGFLYLHESLQTKEGCLFPMAGVILGNAFPTEKLSRFGYVELTPKSDTSLLKTGERIRGHEFHYWDSTKPGKSMRAEKPDGGRRNRPDEEDAIPEEARGGPPPRLGWDCMHVSGFQAAGFVHLYYPSNPEFIRRWLDGCRRYQVHK